MCSVSLRVGATAPTRNDTEHTHKIWREISFNLGEIQVLNLVKATGLLRHLDLALGQGLDGPLHFS